MKAQPRNGATDLARFAGALGIVWFHAHGPGAWIGHAALQMFMALLIYHMLGADRGLPLGRTARGRARRLLGPWLAWSAIFAAAKVADGLIAGSGVAAEFEPWMLLAGPSLHLWFLPFAFAAGLAALAGWRALTGRRGEGAPGRIAPALFAGGLLALAVLQAACLGAETLEPPRPLRQWLHVAPAVLLGLLLHAAEARPDRLVALLATQAGLLAAGPWAGLALASEQTLLGAFFAVAAVSLRLPSGDLTRALGALSLGIYLCHPLFAAALARAMPADEGTAFALAVALSATLFAAALRATPLRALAA